MSDFLARASQERLLTPDQVARLSEASHTQAIDPAELAVKQGVLSPDEAEAVQTLLAGDKALPGYEVLGILGRGGMGVVYRARQTSLDRPVALKTISARHLGDAVSGMRFENEAHTAARLQHPNIVAVYDFGRHEGRLFLAMELLEGHDLDSFITKRGPLPEALGWHVARQAAAGLAHAAALDVVHRDIKPGNLLLVAPPAGYPLPPDVPLVKITDFGLAFLASEAGAAARRVTLAGTTVGSPHYMSPEQLRSPTVDLRADIYSLGATLRHAFTGRPPFDGPTVGDILAKKITHALPPLRSEAAHLSQAGAELVEDMMAETPSDRPGTYAELLERIDHLLAGIPAVGTTGTPASWRAAALTQAEMPSTRPQQTTSAAKSAGRPLSRRAWLFSGAALALASGAGFWAWRCPVKLLGDPAPLTWHTQETSLFNGATLEGWQIAPGSAWGVGRDREKALVLEGRDFARRMLPTEFDHYQISLSVSLATAHAFEIQFGYQHQGVAPYYVLQLEAHSARLKWIGPWRAATVAAQVLSEPTEEVSDYRELRLERRQEGWAVYVHSERLAFVNHLHENPAPEITLGSLGGKTWLENIRFVPPA